MQILPLGAFFALLFHARALLAATNEGNRSVSARSSRGSRRETRPNQARDGAPPPVSATGASAAELRAQQAAIRDSLNSTQTWRRGGETWPSGRTKRDRSRTAAPAEEPSAGSPWGPTRHHNKRTKLNSTRTPAGGRYNAAKPSSMGGGERGGAPEEGDRRKRGTKDEQKKAPKRGRGRANKSPAQPHASPWEPLPRPLALTSTDLPPDLYTRRPEFFTFREENPWDATPITPPSLPELGGGGEIKNPFYPVTGETYGAYAITCVSGVIFLVGVAGNVAILCIVCQNYYMKSISNSLLANLAVWDFALILFCLPMVVFHQLTKSWLLGEFTCKVVPYMEVNAFFFFFFFFSDLEELARLV